MNENCFLMLIKNHPRSPQTAQRVQQFLQLKLYDCVVKKRLKILLLIVDGRERMALTDSSLFTLLC